MNEGPIKAGIAGLGRSGWDIHVHHLRSMPEQFTIAAASDPDASRRNEAASSVGCKTYEHFEQLIADPSVELIVVATPSHLHVPHVIAALAAGKHVVCEKPFALSVGDAERAIRAAGQAGRLCVPFHNRRYEAHLLKVKQIVESGLLGQITQIRMTWESFGRRWDWQTLKEFGGGSLNNTGPHLLDHALQLFGDSEPQVFAVLRHTAMSAGDADDYAKVILHSPGHPTVDCELSSSAAYPHDRWNIMGTAGGLRGTPEKLEWRWIDWSKMPPRAADRAPTAGRSFNSEKLEWQSDTWTHPADTPHTAVQFYHDLHASIRENQPHPITPQSALRLIKLLETCHRMSPV